MVVGRKKKGKKSKRRIDMYVCMYVYNPLCVLINAILYDTVDYIARSHAHNVIIFIPCMRALRFTDFVSSVSRARHVRIRHADPQRGRTYAGADFDVKRREGET